MKLTRLMWLSLVFPLPALAHVNSLSLSSVSAGLMHPLLGLDHLMVLIGAAAWLAQTPSMKKILGLLVVIIGCLSAGVALGYLIPGVDMHNATLASLLVLGILAAASRSWSAKTKLIVLSIAGLVHGFSHGTALSLPMFSGFTLGIIASSALVLCAVTAAFIAVRKYAGGQWLKVLGFGAAMFGLGLGV